MSELAEAAVAREFRFTEKDFQRVRALICKLAGISLAASKHDLVYSRLARRLRATGHQTFTAYLDALESTPDAAEWQAFTNALTTNLTSFFRERHHFDVLREHLRSRPPGSRILLWSCAASTGEEPYSLAMTAAEAFGTLSPPVSILATDIDTNVLAVGEQGVYPLERVTGLAPDRVRRFFRRGVGSNDGYCRVVDELRQLVSFRPLNLLADQWGLRGPFSAIFCRNVMIYFDKPTQERLMRRLVPLLSTDGLLFTGHSESLFHVDDLVVPAGRTVYGKRQPGKPSGRAA